jgi:hypothetical protein
MWKKFFRPHYEEFQKAVKSAGWHWWFHSCGKINDIIDDLIEIGVEVINLQQPQTVGIKEIGKKYKGKICFATANDIQNTIGFGRFDPEKMRKEAIALIEHWAAPNGGFILDDYADGAAIGVGEASKITMLAEFLKVDPWRKNVTGLE